MPRVSRPAKTCFNGPRTHDHESWPSPEGDAVQGRRHKVTSADGTEIGLLTAGSGPALLLVHGGMGRLERWAPLWALLTGHWQVTAMDRRGRGSSGDTAPYRLNQEYDDVAAVATSLAHGQGRPADVFAHSYGALCTLGAAARGAPFRRIALYEPPGPQTVPREWRERASALVAAGHPGRAMISFLTEIIGLTMAQVSELRDTPGAQDVLPIVAATLPREAGALASADPLALASGLTARVLLLLGETSPAWATDITHALSAALPQATLAVLPGCGHEAIDAAPGLVYREVAQFLA
jgi:pimeloyl-ACP methyl ester carboxylesterase